MFDFVMKYENIEFGEALRLLAEKAGIELRRENPAEYKFSGLLYDLNNSAKDYFRKMLAAAPIAKEYLAKRGLSQQTIEDFEIGWAPNDPEGLSMHLLNSGTAPQDLLQAGLSIKTERGMMLDRFRGRIMFPIHNHTGKVVGFTGRILPEFDKPSPPTTANPTGFVPAKYVNSPETPIFQKSKLLYGFWRSKEAIRETKTAFLVEGQMDFLMSYQSGVHNVIASSGTALTSEHLQTIHRLAENLVVSFDNDAAGSDAAERAIDLAEAADFSVKVSTFKGFKDAAEAALADPTNVVKVYEAAMPAPEFYFAKYLPKEMNSTDGGSAASASAAAEFLSTREGLRDLRAILVKLRHLASPVERNFWIRELSKRTGVAEKTLEEETAKAINSSHSPSQVNNASSRAGDEVAAVVPKKPATRQELICEKLFSAALAEGAISSLAESIPFFTPVQKEIFVLLKDGKTKSEDASLDAALEVIVMKSGSQGSAAEDIAGLKAELAKEYYKERRKILSQAIKNAEARNNETELAAALEELKNLPPTNESRWEE